MIPRSVSGGGYEIIIERCFVFGKHDTGSGMVIHLGEGKFLGLVGWDLQVRTKSLSPIEGDVHGVLGIRGEGH